MNKKKKKFDKKCKTKFQCSWSVGHTLMNNLHALRNPTRLRFLRGETPIPLDLKIKNIVYIEKYFQQNLQ